MIEAAPDFKYKQCLIVRTDIKMSGGKRCAQTAHAAVSAFEKADKTVKRAWLGEGQKKVVLKVASVRDLYELKTLAEEAGIAASLITDAGMTEIPPGTVTALGLGPAKAEELDRICGDLSLL
jgi:PTH2 family peptidyl-tRNA hydrolase